MKRLVLNILTWPPALFLRLFRPLGAPLSRLYYLILARAQLSGVPASAQFDGPVLFTGNRNIKIGMESRLGQQMELETQAAGLIEIGCRVRINRGTTIVSYEHISIGDDCLIGEFVSIRDANHGIAAGTKIRLQEHKVRPIRIEAGAWIGRGVCILPGVTLGAGCVVGANSVVTRDVPAGVVVAGIPAKVIKNRE